MLLSTLFFFFLSIALLASMGVIFSVRTTYNVLSLVLVFLATSGIFVMLNAAFLGFVLVILYVGAVAVFFLFAVMLFGNQIDQPTASEKKIFWPGVLIMILLTGLGFVFLLQEVRFASVAKGIETHFTASMIGETLYENYVEPLLAVALALLAAIFGGIYLTHKQKADHKRQRAFLQMHASGKKRLSYVHVDVKKGLQDD